jgi:hypothetical protein
MIFTSIRMREYERLAYERAVRTVDTRRFEQRYNFRRTRPGAGLVVQRTVTHAL